MYFFCIILGHTFSFHQKIGAYYPLYIMDYYSLTGIIYHNVLIGGMKYGFIFSHIFIYYMVYNSKLFSLCIHCFSTNRIDKQHITTNCSNNTFSTLYFYSICRTTRKLYSHAMGIICNSFKVLL